MSKRRYNKRSLNHMSISVQGVLTQYKKKKITFCDHDDGTRMSDAEARQIFMQAQFEGKRVLPMSNECYRFDHQTGCKGHILALLPTDEDAAKIEIEWTEWKNQKAS